MDTGETIQRPARQPIDATCVALVILALSGCGFLGHKPAQLASPFEEIRQQIHLTGGPLEAGTARVEITPPVGTPLAGHSKRRGKPSVGIRDPLYVRALALSDREDTVVILSADLLLFPPPLAEALLARICRETGLPHHAVVLAGTHTHSGTGGIAPGFLYEQVFGRYDEKLVEGLSGRISWAAAQALQDRHPVQWGGAQDPQGLAALLENRAQPKGPVDPRLFVLSFAGSDGAVKAVVVNWAAHPTLMDSRDFRFSADFPGEICRRVEELYPGSVCLFLNGAAGDTRPRDAIGANAEERIQWVGAAAAEEVSGLVNQSAMKSKGEIAAWGGLFPLPPPQVRLGPIPLHPSIGRRMRPTTVFLHLIALDDITLAPLSAEMTAEAGRRLSENFRQLGTEPLLAGYAGGYIGYAVTAEQYRSGSYEASMTWYGPGLAELLRVQLTRLAELRNEKKE